MSTIRADNISPVGSTLNLTAPVAGLSVAGGLTVGGIAFFSGGVTFNSTTNFTGLVTLTGGATSAAVISCGTAPTQGQHLVNKTYVDGQAIGVGQSWVDVTGSRAVATTYTNNTGKPIMVLITCRTGQRLDNNQVNGVSIGDIVSISTTTQNLTFIVPSGHTYSVGNTALTGRGFYIWSELR